MRTVPPSVGAQRQVIDVLLRVRIALFHPVLDGLGLALLAGLILAPAPAGRLAWATASCALACTRSCSTSRFESRASGAAGGDLVPFLDVNLLDESLDVRADRLGRGELDGDVALDDQFARE